MNSNIKQSYEQYPYIYTNNKFPTKSIRKVITQVEIRRKTNLRAPKSIVNPTEKDGKERRRYAKDVIREPLSTRFF